MRGHAYLELECGVGVLGGGGRVAIAPAAVRLHEVLNGKKRKRRKLKKFRSIFHANDHVMVHIYASATTCREYGNIIACTRSLSHASEHIFSINKQKKNKQTNKKTPHSSTPR